VCTASDIALITAGVAGFGVLVTAYPGVVTWARVGGAAFLLGYAALALWRTTRPAALTPSEAAPDRVAAVLLTCLAMTFLNPHVYLDTVVLLGALANEHRDERWLFGLGAVCASAVWFVTLGFGAGRLRALFATPAAWRVLDGMIAATMVVLAVFLVT
jgi:L-lysine exporter family protein LysE/ArgO